MIVEPETPVYEIHSVIFPFIRSILPLVGVGTVASVATTSAGARRAAK